MPETRNKHKPTVDDSLDDSVQTQAPSQKHPGGRPTDYNEDIVDEICIRISTGEPLVRICREDGMPHLATVYRWLSRYPEFSEMYAKAKDQAADTLAEEIQDLADQFPMEKTDKEGNTSFDSAYIQWMRLRVDARKWVAAKLKPRKYGDRVELAGDKDNPLKLEATIEAKGLFNDLLQNLELKRQVDK
jgi:hypothetical protein